MTDDIPNLTETEITDLWRFRQEHENAESFHKGNRRAADQEVLRRGADAKAEVLATRAGDITITFPNKYAYDSHVVDNEFFQLIQRDGLQEEWNKNVRHEYKIDKRWLNRLAKRGEEYQKAIDNMTMATTGTPKIEGPPLNELGEYATPAEVAQ
jgi:hypothetical protein